MANYQFYLQKECPSSVFVVMMYAFLLVLQTIVHKTMLLGPRLKAFLTTSNIPKVQGVRRASNPSKWLLWLHLKTAPFMSTFHTVKLLKIKEN